MATKTYVLLENMNADAPVYMQLGNGQREKITKIPFHRPTLRQQYYDENGNSKVIRYKSYSKFIDQWKQIDEEKILANEPFSQPEYNDLKFRHGVLVTNKIKAQEYLEAHPEFTGFKGACDDIKQPRYKLLDEVADAKNRNSDIRLRAKALNKVLSLDLTQLQAMLIRLNGSFFATPNEKEECENLLVEFIDDAEESGLNSILKDEENTTVDEKTTVLIGQLINSGKLSFDAVEGNVSKKDKDGKWVEVRSFSTEYSLDERKRLFSNFLNTPDGKPLKNDLENDLRETSNDEEVEVKKKMGRPPKIN